MPRKPNRRRQVDAVHMLMPTAIQLNPNLLSIDSLMQYEFSDGLVGHGADHDDWNVHRARRYFRGLLGYDKPSRALP